MKKTTLAQTCRLYRTDKDLLHCYIDHVYEDLFSPIRNSASMIMEIGVEDGGSICMWNDYFHKAKIFAVDKKDCPQLVGRRGVKFVLGDAYTYEVLDSLPDGFDVIIDDGPHTLESMMFAVEQYSRKLVAGGMLVLEDLQDFNWTNIIRRNMPPDLESRVFDLRNVRGRYDDILMVLTKA